MTILFNIDLTILNNDSFIYAVINYTIDHFIRQTFLFLERPPVQHEIVMSWIQRDVLDRRICLMLM